MEALLESGNKKVKKSNKKLQSYIKEMFETPIKSSNNEMKHHKQVPTQT